MFNLTLRGAHFLKEPITKVKVVPKVFGVADYDSAIKISKFKMADPRWQLLFSKSCFFIQLA